MDGIEQAHGERALFRAVSAWGVESVHDDLAVLDEPAFHALVVTFEGRVTAARLRHVVHHEDRAWAGALEARLGSDEPDHQASTVAQGAWSTSLDRGAYERGVAAIRDDIARGRVYQVNLCRVLERDGADGAERDDLDRLFADLLVDNPAPYACRIDVEGHVDIASASPELFLAREGSALTSAPIKGTASTLERMLAKDATENIMITDLVRNDLQRVCRPGTVSVDGLLEAQHHPGLVHLVSTVRGQMRDGVRWPEVFDATFPPGSVSGAPKSSALDVIAELETAPRGPYCGAIGWVDGTTGQAELAVAIRTFWRENGREIHRNESASGPIVSGGVSFGAGAGITWDSDPGTEWHETELKARRLLGIADGRHTGRNA